MDGLTVGAAAKRTGWSPRMLRYLERTGLVVPTRTRGGYREYSLRDLNQLRALAELRARFAVGIDDLAFALRLRRDARLKAAVDTWLAGTGQDTSASAAWVEWEQRKHERLLAA